MEFNSDFAKTKLQKNGYKITGRILFGGIGFPHFGHFMCFSSHRIWAVGKVKYDKIIFFADRPNPLIEQCVSLLGGDPSKVCLVPTKTNVEIDELIIPERGICSSHEYNRILRKTHVLSDECDVDLFITRRFLKEQGFVAGGSFISSVLKKEGFLEFVPEDHSYLEQHSLYLRARRVVITDGSSIHGFDLIGDLSRCKICVLNRRPASASRFLKDKSKVLVDTGITHTAGQVVPRLSLAFVDIGNVVEKFKEIGVHINPDLSKFYDAEGADALNFVIRQIASEKRRSTFTLDHITDIIRSVRSEPHKIKLKFLRKLIKDNGILK